MWELLSYIKKINYFTVQCLKSPDIIVNIECPVFRTTDCRQSTELQVESNGSICSSGIRLVKNGTIYTKSFWDLLADFSLVFLCMMCCRELGQHLLKLHWKCFIVSDIAVWRPPSSVTPWASCCSLIWPTSSRSWISATGWSSWRHTPTARHPTSCCARTRLTLSRTPSRTPKSRSSPKPMGQNLLHCCLVFALMSLVRSIYLRRIIVKICICYPLYYPLNILSFPVYYRYCRYDPFIVRVLSIKCSW